MTMHHLSVVRRGAVGVLVLALVVLTSAAPAGASQVWTVVPSANQGTITNFLYDVSCTSAKTCTAVGFHTATGADLALIETRNGGNWKIVPSPSPGATWNFLYGVSCATAKSCMAVGRYETFNGINRNLALSWNGKVWSTLPVINRGMYNNALTGVACVAVNFCVAVGSWSSIATGKTQTLVESWNGKTWSVVPSPSPTGPVTALNRVSCVSTRACTAVGHYEDAQNVEQTLVESWNGRAWSIVPSPDNGSYDNELTDVSCVSTTSCRAVGSATTVPAGAFGAGGINQSFVESWNGKVWTIAENPNPGTVLTTLSSVSCISAKSCTAVGSYQDAGSNLRRTLVESWNGSAWKVVSSPNPKPGTAPDNYIGGITGSGLNGVSCVSVTSCHAVGFHDNASGHDESLIVRFG